jgi:hypothetical protein
MFALFGASLLSAAASLPLHLLPLLVVSVVADPHQTAADAGRIAGACMLGQMLVALALPAFKLSNLRRRHALAAVTLLVVSLAVSSAWPIHGLWLPWLVIGGACGALQFLGATTAAAAADPPAAFALRLSVTLLVSGLVIVGLQHSGGFLDYATLAVALSIFFALLTGLGLALYRRPELADVSVPARLGGRRNGSPLAGLVVVFLLFVGQPGFWAFAVQSVHQRGVVVEDVAYAIAFCKMAAGVVLFGLTVLAPAHPGRLNLMWPGIGVAAGVTGMALAPGAFLFLGAMLLWELGLNILSARLQATVVRDNPASAGAWLTGAALLGAATGPLLHGMAIEGGMDQAFIVYACASAILPFAWASGRRRA